MYWSRPCSHYRKWGLTIGYVRRLQDMDDRDDITAYRSRMRTQKLLQNTHTGRYLLKKTEDFYHCADL